MDILDEIIIFDKTGGISPAFIKQIRADYIARGDVYNYFKVNSNRDFCLCLLKVFIELRQDLENEIGIEDLMFASYLLGRHGFIEDAMLIWQAKSVDFDSYCGMDGELIAFAGKERTIAFFENSMLPDAQKALKYITEWLNTDNINYFFSNVESNYWVGEGI